MKKINKNKDEIRQVVRKSYGEIAKSVASGCGCAPSSCCGSGGNPTLEEISVGLGYSGNDVSTVPEGANMGLRCGNPTGLAALKEGEVVLDLGSGGGPDCFLAASKVGPSGQVIGVDMTPEMIEKARENVKKSRIKNVDFRLGEIEQLPVADNSVDVVISNCVVNLSPDKPKVFREIYRVLKPGGRIAISDIALLKELPKHIQESIAAYVGCVGGAILIDEYKRIVEASGLRDVVINVKGSSACGLDTQDPLGRALVDGLREGESLEGYAASVSVEGFK